MIDEDHIVRLAEAQAAQFGFVIRGFERQPISVELTVADLSVGTPDYARLVEQIFSSDSIATW